MKEKTEENLGKLIGEIYAIPNDRIHESEDYFYYHRKFLLRYVDELDNKKNEVLNLNIALSWFISLLNHFHIDIENLAWKRYSYKCPFCLSIPCDCGNIKNRKTQKTGRPASGRPNSVLEWQNMVKKIYPNDLHRDIIGQLFQDHEKVHFSYRKFKKESGKGKFHDVELCLVDYYILLIRAYNSVHLDIFSELSKLFSNGCWVCKKTPCECYYYE